MGFCGVKRLKGAAALKYRKKEDRSFGARGHLDTDGAGVAGECGVKAGSQSVRASFRLRIGKLQSAFAHRNHVRHTTSRVVEYILQTFDDPIERDTGQRGFAGGQEFAHQFGKPRGHARCSRSRDAAAVVLQAPGESLAFPAESQGQRKLRVERRHGDGFGGNSSPEVPTCAAGAQRKWKQVAVGARQRLIGEHRLEKRGRSRFPRHTQAFH